MRLFARWNKNVAPDATSFKLTLRGGVKFAEGTPYDAAAVVTNFQRVMDPMLGGQALQQMWKKAGIETEVIPMEATQAIKTAFAHDYQAMAFRWACGTDPDKNVYQFFHTGGAINLVNYSDPGMDKLLDAVAPTSTPQRG